MSSDINTAFLTMEDAAGFSHRSLTNLNPVHAATAYLFKVYFGTNIPPEKFKSHPRM
jgi:hypothetical protein